MTRSRIHQQLRLTLRYPLTPASYGPKPPQAPWPNPGRVAVQATRALDLR